MSDFVAQFQLVGQFTVIPNHCLRDPRLSDRAKGRMAYLASHAVGYRVTIAQQIAETKDGRDSVYSGLKELIEFEYLVRRQERGERGRHGKVSYEWGPAASEQRYERAWGASPQVPTASGLAGSGGTGSGDGDTKNNNSLEPQPKEDQSKTKSPGTVGAERTVRNARGRTGAASPRVAPPSQPYPSSEAMAAFAKLPMPWRDAPGWVRNLLACRLDTAVVETRDHGTIPLTPAAVVEAVRAYAPHGPGLGPVVGHTRQHLAALDEVIRKLAIDVHAGTRSPETGLVDDETPRAPDARLIVEPGRCAACGSSEATSRDTPDGLFACDPCWELATSGGPIGEAA